MHGPPKMVDVMADMIQKGASEGNTGRAHSKGQVSNTITHLKTYMNLEMGVGSLDVTSNGVGLIQKDPNNGMSKRFYVLQKWARQATWLAVSTVRGR